VIPSGGEREESMEKKLEKVLRIYPAEEEQEYTILILCENKPGVTANVSNLISRRGFNITSFIGADTLTEDVYKIIIKLMATPTGLVGVVKQIAKLIDIIEVRESISDEFLEYEMMLVKINYSPQKHGDILQVANHFHGEIVDVHGDKMTIAFNGNPEKLKTVLNLINPFGIVDIVKSGIAVMKKFENNAIRTEKIE
jgi:acetolactate synthase-1/3 small subunit